MPGQIDPDTLRNKQELYVLMAISEGDIEEISDIFLDDISISSYSVDFAYTKGGVNQKAIPGFNFLGGNTTSHGELTVAGGEMILPTFILDVNFVDITISMPDGIYWHTEKGNLRETSISIDVYVSHKETGNFWTRILNTGNPASVAIYKSGKSSSPYVFSARVIQPSNIELNHWRIKLIRRSTDAGSGTETEDYYKTKTDISSQPYQFYDGATYAGTALLGIRIEDASEVGNKIPNISVKGKGLKIWLPDDNSNLGTYYDNINRTYSGTWGGVFTLVTKFSQNLSWVLYNLLSDKLKKTIPLNRLINTSVISGTPSLSQVEGLVTVTLTAHGLITGDYVSISGASPDTFNKTFRKITKITNDSFTYFTNMQGSSSATGTIVISSGDMATKEIIVGLGIPEEYIAKYTFDRYARYCDESVNGEFRYSINGQFIERLDAETAVNNFLTIGNVLLTEREGLVTLVWDHKLTPTEVEETLLFVNQNVDSGIFEYSSAKIEENYTQVNVTIQDIANQNKTKTIISQSSELVRFLRTNSLLSLYDIPSDATDNYFLDLYGYNTVDLVLQGVTSDAAGARKARSLLWDSLLNDKFVTFKTKFEGAQLYRGQIIRINDSFITSVNLTGRILSYSLDGLILSITLDRYVPVDGFMYLTYYPETSIVIAEELNPSVYSYSLSPVKYLIDSLTTGDYNILTITFATLGEVVLPRVESIFGLQNTSTDQLYRVTATTKEEDDYITLGMRYDVNKFDFVEEVYTTSSTSAVPIAKLKCLPIEIRDVDITNFTDIITPSTTYADEAARLADTSYVLADIGTIVEQTTPLSHWIISNVILGTPNTIFWNKILIEPVGTGILVQNSDTFNANAIFSLKWNHDDTAIKAANQNVFYEITWKVDSGQEGSFISYTKYANFSFTIPTNETSLIFTFRIIAKSNLAKDSIPVKVVKTYLVQNNELIDNVGMIEGES